MRPTRALTSPLWWPAPELTGRSAVTERDPGISLLVQALVSEHRDLASMTGKLGEPQRPAAVAAQAAAISALLASHMAKEDSLLLPALERSGTDLTAVLAREPRLAGQCAA